MTSQKLYSESRIPGMFSAKYFGFSLMRSWPHIVFYFIVLLFTIPVPLMLGFNGMNDYPDAETRSRTILSMYQSIMFALAVISTFIAVFAGMTAMGYINSKVSVNFYHSLPLRREGHFITSAAVRYINYLIPLFVNLIIGAIIAYANSGGMSIYFKTMFGSGLMEAVLFFSLIYFITVFAGMISGTGAIRFVLTAWILAVPFFVYAGIIQIIGYGSHTFYEGYYFRAENIQYLSPVIRMTYLASNPLAPAEIFVYAAAVVVLASVSCVLYMKRKSERSGDTVVYYPVGTVVKYVSMFVVTLYFGIWFKEMGNTEYWLIFGFICGCILSFMLINTILYKNARRMFFGVRGFAVFAVSFAAFFAFAGYDVFGLDSKFPPFSMISGITLATDQELTFENPEDIEFIVDCLEEYHFLAQPAGDTEERDNTVYTEQIESLFDDAELQAELQRVMYSFFDDEDYYGKAYLYAYIKLPLGITIARTYAVNPDNFIGIYKFIVESDELDEYFKNQDFSESNYISLNARYAKSDGTAEIWRDSIYTNYTVISDSTKSGVRMESYRNLADLAIKPLRNGVDQQTFNKFSVGTLLHSGGQFPIFSDNEEFFSELSSMSDTQCSGAGAAAAIANSVKRLFVFDTHTEKITEYTSLPEITRIIENSTETGMYSYPSMQTVIIYEPRYRIAYTTDAYSALDMEKYGYQNEYVIAVFREGMVPDFIK